MTTLLDVLKIMGVGNNSVEIINIEGYNGETGAFNVGTGDGWTEEGNVWDIFAWREDRT